jgi:hypothetical protein
MLRWWRMTDANEEEGTEMGAEAPERDDPLPPLRPHPMGVPGVRCEQHQGVQNPRSLIDDAFDAGEREGYAQGYIDGHDAGQDAAFCRLRHMIMTSAIDYGTVIELGEMMMKIERGEL